MTYYDLTIEKYQRMMEALEETGDELAAQATLLAILDDCPVDDILDLPLSAYKAKAAGLSFLGEPLNPKPVCPKTLAIGKEVFEAVRDVRKFTAGQYIDYNTLIKSEDFNQVIHNVLACFFVPKGKDYGKDYDIMEVAEKIRRNVSIGFAMDVCFFFSKEVNSFNQQYAGLFGLDDKDEDEEGGQGDETEAEGGGGEDGGIEGFFQRWNWFYNLDVVSDTLRISWDEVLQKSVVEFLNILSYRKDRNNWEKESIRRANNINGRDY